MKIVNILIAVIAGVIVLLGYFIPSAGLQNIRKPLLDWAVILSGVAGLVAILNLVFGVHWQRIRENHRLKRYSVVVILAFAVTLAAGVWLDPSTQGFQRIVTAVQVPIESSLMAMLALTMVYASLKILQRHRNVMGFIFFISVIIYLVLNSGVLAGSMDIPILMNLLSAFHQVPVAGARGILLGIALGSLATGLRVLTGSDRPYNG